jgi:hypothetical protein
MLTGLLVGPLIAMYVVTFVFFAVAEAYHVYVLEKQWYKSWPESWGPVPKYPRKWYKPWTWPL